MQVEAKMLSKVKDLSFKQSSQPLRHLQQTRRLYATAAGKARLNLPIDYSNHPILTKQGSYALPEASIPSDSPKTRQNFFQSINSALRHALQTDDRTLLFGEDVAFGGVFRCSMELSNDFGSERVFNTPLTEQGIVGFAVGCAAQGMKPVAEIQFADYVYPAFDQFVNEAAKWRFREGATGGNIGGLVVRMPCGSVGHGALYVDPGLFSGSFTDVFARYHSQSPEALFTHIPGLKVVMPRSPAQAKGLLLASINCDDPVIFLEPKILYRAAVEQVPTAAYELPLSRAEVIKEGKDLTIISYGQPLYPCSAAISQAEKDFGIGVELVDLRTLYPWDKETVLESVRKTGRAIVVHESMINAGVGAEIAASIQKGAFLHLEAPVERLGGWATHMGLIFERFNIPDITRERPTTTWDEFLKLTFRKGYMMLSSELLTIETTQYYIDLKCIFSPSGQVVTQIEACCIMQNAGRPGEQDAQHATGPQRMES